MRTAYSGYGDIPFHMTQVSKFAFSKGINLNEPIFDGERLRYAFLVNLLSAIFLRASGNWTFATQFPVMILMAIGIIFTFFSYRAFLRSSIAAGLAAFVFLLGSGFGGYNIVQKQWIEAGRTPAAFVEYLVSNNVSTIIKWDAKFPDQNIVWGAPMSLVFLHQRAFILGFCLFSVFWYLLLRWSKRPNKRLALTIGVIVGLSPLSHYHTFIAMLIVLLIVSTIALYKKGRHKVNNLFLIAAVSILLALPQILYLVSGKQNLVGNQSFITFRLGWMVEPTIGSVPFAPEQGKIFGVLLPFLTFLWINFGLVLPVFALTFILVLLTKKFRDLYSGILLISTIAITLFFLGQLIRFQPWDFDNNKIFVYFQFFAAPVIVALFIWVAKFSKLVGLIGLLIFVLAVTFTGVLDQIPRVLVKTEQIPVIFGSDSIAMAEFIKKNVSQNEKIITTSTHLNPVSSLAGRPVMVGYPGWLWTRGINYSVREGNLKSYYSNPLTNTNIPILYGANFVLVDPTAIYDWKADTTAFDSRFKLLFRSGQYSLYAIK